MRPQRSLIGGKAIVSTKRDRDLIRDRPCEPATPSAHGQRAPEREVEGGTTSNSTHCASFLDVLSAKEMSEMVREGQSDGAEQLVLVLLRRFPAALLAKERAGIVELWPWFDLLAHPRFYAIATSDAVLQAVAEIVAAAADHDPVVAETLASVIVWGPVDESARTVHTNFLEALLQRSAVVRSLTGDAHRMDRMLGPPEQPSIWPYLEMLKERYSR
jgi:hypothetical protein